LGTGVQPLVRRIPPQYRRLEHHYKTHKPIAAEAVEEEPKQKETTEEPPRYCIHVVGGRPASEHSPDPTVSGSAKQAIVKTP
jgi:hypothetical protein